MLESFHVQLLARPCGQVFRLSFSHSSSTTLGYLFNCRQDHMRGMDAVACDHHEQRGWQRSNGEFLDSKQTDLLGIANGDPGSSCLPPAFKCFREAWRRNAVVLGITRRDARLRLLSALHHLVNSHCFGAGIMSFVMPAPCGTQEAPRNNMIAIYKELR